MTKMEEITQKLVRELLDYDPRYGVLTWKPRARKWFTSDADWNRWNNRYSGSYAFRYVHGGRRWGCILGQNCLAHRIAWLHVYGHLPRQVRFRNGDATDIRLNNMIDNGGERLVA